MNYTWNFHLCGCCKQNETGCSLFANGKTRFVLQTYPPMKGIHNVSFNAQNYEVYFAISGVNTDYEIRGAYDKFPDFFVPVLLLIVHT